MHKSQIKRGSGGHLDIKGGAKFCSPENFPQFFGESGLLNDKTVDRVSSIGSIIHGFLFPYIYFFFLKKHEKVGVARATKKQISD